MILLKNLLRAQYAQYLIKDITIFFGSTDNTTSKDVNLPEIDKATIEKTGFYAEKVTIASLFKRYHDSKLHLKMSPKTIEAKKIFDEIES